MEQWLWRYIKGIDLDIFFHQQGLAYFDGLQRRAKQASDG
jgi:hypothetical protein